MSLGHLPKVRGPVIKSGLANIDAGSPGVVRPVYINDHSVLQSTLLLEPDLPPEIANKNSGADNAVLINRKNDIIRHILM